MDKHSKRLMLSRETVRELSRDEMTAAGGAQTLVCLTPVIHTLPLKNCLYTNVDCIFASLPVVNSCIVC